MNDMLYDLIRYVNLEMFFDKYKDFYKRAKTIKRKYKELDCKGINVYKNYVYEKEFSSNLKNDLWEYLNDDLKYIFLPIPKKEKK